ncbi:MAG: C-GCAxxG-C-C family protein [Planctomycetia bacterium]|nr:C-GCAxxG-C-C family protein [Planctomycetia bacterium]
MDQNPQLSRRSALAGGLGAAFCGLSFPLFADEAEDNEGEDEVTKSPRKRRPRNRPKREKTWNYVTLDPEKCAQLAYDFYDPWGCMYGAIKAGMTVYAEAIEETNPEIAATCRNFPFLALRAGKTGCGAMESLCGALNGSAFFMGLFVPDYGELCQLIQKVGDYIKETPMPQFHPQNDKHPNFVQSVSHSILCKDNTTVWLAQDPSPEHRLLRPERCMRYTATVLAFATTLLNEYFAQKEKEKKSV